jgi:hypothetical protein
MKRLIAALLAVAVSGLALATLGGAETVKPLYGKVVSVDTTTGKVVVTTGDNGPQVTVATDSNTKVIVADKAATLADLKAGMGVRIMPPTGTATEIRGFVPKTTTQPPTTQPRALYGTVVSVDTTTGNVVLKTLGDNPHEVTVATDSNTKVIVSDKPATLADLKAGMTARVAPATGKATEIRGFYPKPTSTQPTSTQPKPLYGTIVSIDAATGKFVIKTPGENSQQVTVATDADTKIIISDKASTVDDLKVGMHAAVTPPTGTAKEIHAYMPKPPTNSTHRK